MAVDSVSPTVFIISEAGDLIKWFDCSDYMREPSDIAVSGREFFVCDFKVIISMCLEIGLLKGALGRIFFFKHLFHF